MDPRGLLPGGGGGARHVMRRFGMRCSPSHLFFLQHEMQHLQHSLGYADAGESGIWPGSKGEPSEMLRGGRPLAPRLGVWLGVSGVYKQERSIS